MNAVTRIGFDFPFGNPSPHATDAAVHEVNSRWRRWSVVVLYALAMAWVEAAVVFYIRSHIDRLVPYQPEPLPLAGGFALAEVVREGATMIMLATVGWLAGWTRRSRIAFALLAFGVWDIAYYIWLVPLTGWPASLFDWDILFLIPLPWWGPVWAPMSIAALMVMFGTIVGLCDSPERPLLPSRASCATAAIGVVVALCVFMADSMRVILATHSAEQLRTMLPQWFNWPLFAGALALLAAPVVSVFRQARAYARSMSATHFHSADDCTRDSRRLTANEAPMKNWLNYFEHNRDNRRVVPWKEQLNVAPGVVRPFIRSLQRFQIGESGEGRHLRAAANTTGNLTYIKAIDLFIKEEQEHARLMGEILKRLNAPLLTSHWSDGCFILLRRLFRLNQELMVLLVPEIIAKRYFRVVHDHIQDETVRAVCAQILHDEERHVAFHVEYLRCAFGNLSVSARALLRGAWRALFRLSVLVVLSDHRSFLRASGVSASSFWWDCELMFDDVSAQIFAFAPSGVPEANVIVTTARV